MDIKKTKADWNRIQVFYVVGKLGKIALASKHIGIAQPSISRTIRLLEEELGVKLFFRGVQGMTFTTEGAHLFETASHIYAELQTAIKIIRHEEDAAPRRNYTLLLAEWDKTVRLDVEDARQRKGVERAQTLLESAVAETVHYVRGMREAILAEMAAE